jgi:hypothetical protein
VTVLLLYRVPRTLYPINKLLFILLERFDKRIHSDLSIATAAPGRFDILGPVGK